MRLWPREANRSDQAATPDAKLFLRDAPDVLLAEEPLLEGQPCNFRTAGDVLRASSIPEDQRGIWLATCPVGPLKDWHSADRAAALRRAVDERRAQLYKILWDLAGFGAWWNEVRRLSEELPEPRP